MNGLLIFGPILTMILVALLEKRWQRLVALGATYLLLFGTLQVVTNEVKKAAWAQSRIRIGEPTRRLLEETRDQLNAGQTSEAVQLLTFMTEKWRQIDVAPWMKSVKDVRSEYRSQKNSQPQGGGYSPPAARSAQPTP
jgi:hypothetical protein